MYCITFVTSFLSTECQTEATDNCFYTNSWGGGHLQTYQGRTLGLWALPEALSVRGRYIKFGTAPENRRRFGNLTPQYIPNYFIFLIVK